MLWSRRYSHLFITRRGAFMPSIEASIEIAQSPQEVFDYLVRAENLPVWDVSVVRAEEIGNGPAGLGMRTRGASQILGKQFEWTTEVTQFDPPWAVTYTSVDGQMQFAVSYTLESTAGGTHLMTHLDAESGLGGVFGRLTDPLIARVQGRTVRANLETLAELLDQA
jgi:uncharacterized protein YndB with AHSA1/START domain